MKKNSTLVSFRLWLFQALLALAVVVSAHATEAPSVTFDKTFNPDTIGPGSVSTLQFVITNTATALSDLAFTDTLPAPAGVTIATPANVTNTCGGTLTAPDGGGTITFVDGVLGAGTIPSPSSCTISVDVTSSTTGTHTNLSGDLTSDAGNHGTASDDLMVVTTLPGFTKGFSPSPIALGSRSTLTLTIDNSANPSPAFFLNFTDNLPTGMVIATPANASVSSACLGGTLTATPGTNVISYGGSASVGAGSSCTISVDVIATGAGMLGNTTGELSSGSPTVSSGKASAVLDVTVDPLSLVKSFTDDPVPPGSTVTLEFTISNLDRDDSATDIEFTDDDQSGRSSDGSCSSQRPAPAFGSVWLWLDAGGNDDGHISNTHGRRLASRNLLYVQPHAGCSGHHRDTHQHHQRRHG